ncbi:hypothetical protein Lepto7376_0459 [[Leptolyngbya] sp. PCC 7376]|uniref:DUF4345 domain-containing protein n=1 Tax=[Leptolyngbya] sp. PCC 7376 TaxID=111781 RepID=UPI00029F46B1|nr:DUF4345 domain-containing protein [[Leptolyngbya] sp. PCC 7376]AFY36892.1 hypothetical protein Lepto7376_0459 [[Leptolyngbya] sp. PCC 7376]
MKDAISLKLVLAIDALVAIAVGAMIQLSPADFYAMNHIDIGENLNLLSEIRAPAMALLSYGILILAGIFISRLTFTATLLASTFYLSYGVARIVSIGLDGWPSESLITAAVIEIVLGLASLFCLWKYANVPNLGEQQ